MKLNNEQLLLECYGARVYTHFCDACGCDKMDEINTLNEIRCSKCGNNSFRLIRDTNTEILLLNPEGTLQ